LIRGTGPDGRVTAKDVDSYVPSAAPAVGRPAAAAAGAAPSSKRAAAAPAGVDDYTDIPLTNIRQVLLT